MIPLAIYDILNTYHWLQLREQLFNLREFHQKKIQLDTIPYEYICKSWSVWATSCKKLGIVKIRSITCSYYDWPGRSIMSKSNKFSQ